MASLKEIKGRISSVQTTQKTTSAMRMVASAKLHRTQAITQTFLEYVDEMRNIIDCLMPDGHGVSDGENRQVINVDTCTKIVIVAVSSSSGLCGSFNSNIIKATFNKMAEYRSKGKEVIVIPIGKKIAHELHKAGEDVLLDYYSLADYIGNPKSDAYAHAAFLIEHLIHMYNEGEIDGVEFLYHHFKNMGSQVITSEWLDLSGTSAFDGDVKLKTDYLTEPSPAELLRQLGPKMMNSRMYGILLDSVTSEHAARMMAMQTADDNAKELLQELVLLYNKSRQQAITNELIDIMGGKTAE